MNTTPINLHPINTLSFDSSNTQQSNQISNSVNTITSTSTIPSTTVNTTTVPANQVNTTTTITQNQITTTTVPANQMNTTTTSTTSATTTIPQNVINAQINLIKTQDTQTVRSLLGRYPSTQGSSALISQINSTNLITANQIIPKLNSFFQRGTNVNNVQINTTYGTVMQSRKYVGAGSSVYYISNNSTGTTLYSINVQKAAPPLSVTVGGIKVSGTNTTQVIHYPILSAGSTYRVTPSMLGLLAPNNTAPFNYSIKMGSQTIASGVVNATTFNQTLSYDVPTYDNFSVTLDTKGNANYSMDDPTAVVLPTPIIAFVNITLQNTQATGTPQPFQQLITVNSLAYKSYETGNLMNIEFFYANQTIIPSWLGGNNLIVKAAGIQSSSTNTIYWLKISNGIPASGSINVYMGFASTSTDLRSNTLTGEDPQVSNALGIPFGQFDDGNIVFNYYRAFGNSIYNQLNGVLPQGWVLIPGAKAGLASFTASGYQLGVSAGTTQNGITTKTSFVIPGNIFDISTILPTDGGSAFRLAGFGIGQANAVGTYFLTTANKITVGGTTAGAFYGSYHEGTALKANVVTAQTSLTTNTYVASQHVYGIGLDGSNIYFLSDNANIITSGTKPSTTTLNLTVLSNLTVVTTLSWTRLRALPTGGVMPAVSFAAVANTLVSNFIASGLLPLAASVGSWNVVYGGVTLTSTTNLIAVGTNAGNFPYSVANQVINGVLWSASPVAGNSVDGNTITITFTPNVLICGIQLSNSLIGFNSVNPGSFIATSNLIVDTNFQGTTNANILVAGGNWIATAGSGNFFVANTLWDPSSRGAGSGNVLHSQLLAGFQDTLTTMTGYLSSNIYFGVGIPPAQIAATYTQNIVIENSC